VIVSFESKIRKLARLNYWQNIYSASQKCSGIRLFENIFNYSGLQTSFLYWLSIYDMLFSELSTHEDEFLTSEILEDDERTDAYLIYRNKKHDYLWRKHRAEEKNSQLKANRKKGFQEQGNETFINVDLRREE